ncbi:MULTISPECIES: SMI1/KNR4 family protein [unclassified Kribbella]|uniref:SMI1/KNR4 family protein n=1 Tax=unclassified Kribbella TaxID=2644121 RepID=UPI0034022322
MDVTTSWHRIINWLTAHDQATATLINPPATAVDLRYLEAAINRPLPADLVALLELANGTEHRAIQGSLIPTLYNLVPVKDMLSTRQMLQKIQHRISGPGPWPGACDPAGRPTTEWLDSFLPIAAAGDAGHLYVDLRDGDQFGFVWEWYPEGGGASAPWWGSVSEMLDDVAAALVDGRPALRTYSNGAVWPEQRLSPQLPDVDDGYLRWFAV